MSDPQPSSGGLFQNLKRLADGGLALAQSRLELFSVELQMEKVRLVELLILAAMVVALGLMTLTMLTFTLVFLFWETARMPVLIVVSVAYLGGTLFAWRALKVRLAARSAFSGTLGEIKKDRACLETET
ncbi:hypothetical protein LBMAG56_38660 [Verrucomicrobiota bacterium]|nr:hypothetical protein LBMAG56_38660 [Verrucomicrobiota bacterium]